MILRASARLLSTSGEWPGRLASISLGMPHTPCGGGSMAAPSRSWPWLRMSLNALLSMASISAWRNSGLLNGGASRLIRMLELTLVARASQTASGLCALTSFKSGKVTSLSNVMSNSPEPKPSRRVLRLGTILQSMASR